MEYPMAIPNADEHSSMEYPMAIPNADEHSSTPRPMAAAPGQHNIEGREERDRRRARAREKGRIAAGGTADGPPAAGLRGEQGTPIPATRRVARPLPEPAEGREPGGSGTSGPIGPEAGRS